MPSWTPLVQILGGLAAVLALVGLAALLRSRPLRWLALLSTLGLGGVAVRFGLAWAAQLAQGRTNTAGPGYGVMVLLTPIVVAGVLFGVAPLVLHLSLWRSLRAPAPPLTPVRRGATGLLGAVFVAGLVSAVAPGVVQRAPARPLAGVAFTRGGDELLAWDQLGLVRSWKSGETRVDATWELSGGGVTTPIAVSPHDRWVVIPSRGKARLLSLPDGGGAPTVLAEHDGDTWGFPAPGRAAVALGGRVTLLEPGKTGTPSSLQWRVPVTALAGGDAGSLLLADQDGVVSWVDLGTGEPRRSVQLPAEVVRLAPLDGGRRALAVTKDGAAWVVGADPPVMRRLERRRAEDPVAPFTDRGLLVAFGPEVHRVDAITGEERPFVNHGQGPASIAGHPREARAAVVLPGALWVIAPGATPNSPLVEQLVLAWP
jgi:hypothetical protein